MTTNERYIREHRTWNGPTMTSTYSLWDRVNGRRKRVGTAATYEAAMTWCKGA